ncbi:ATP-binding protein [Candidatus Uhrbacteria bacterium]|nr:ATP-binding protein [Candidatus Uhrbacteria bacterium]
MTHYRRKLRNTIIKDFFLGKVIILIGARQVGKTTLMQDIFHASTIKNKKILSFNCDDPHDRDLLAGKNSLFLKGLVNDYDIVFIDEGQKVADIGQTVKILVDYYKKKKQIIVTGSSSINLLDATSESLTGRKFTHILYPLSLEEIFSELDPISQRKKIEHLMIFGSYPEIVSQASFDSKERLLRELASSALYKDIFEFQQVKNPQVLFSLLKALGLQIGSEYSMNELSRTCGIDVKTVERYIDLLEKNYIIFRLPPYTKNKRREITKLKKIYFYDTGIRNVIINNFNFSGERTDMGGLWENFIIAERMKYRAYHGISALQYFWRTYDGAEIDLIEEQGSRVSLYECKWNAVKKRRKPPHILRQIGRIRCISLQKIL